MTVYDEAARPRVLYYKGPTRYRVDSGPVDFEEIIGRHVGTVTTFDSKGQFGIPQVRWESWDAVIAIGTTPQGVADHLRVIQIGGHPLGMRSQGEATSYSLQSRQSLGTEIELGKDLTPEERSLVKSTVLPALRALSLPRQSWDLGDWQGDANWTRVFASDLDGLVFAADYRPDVGPNNVVYLPDSLASDPAAVEAWIIWALTEWSKYDSARFPAPPDWRSEPAWMTDAERSASARVEEAEDALEAAIEHHETELHSERETLASIREEADGTLRRLLTGTGDPLSDAVADALKTMGFDVTDTDEGRREKRDDLRVRDGDWVAVTEVKGYSKGGSTRDLLTLSRWVELYIKETGNEPDARWYICNQFRNTHPDQRRELLRGQDDDVDVFAESNGLAIDTRNLFRLVRDVEARVIEQDAARELLRQSVGRFSYPS
ncbi:hypothetical protein [Gordonia terrae]|uniref:hypothetical protein n=1 Tax=Gordonia terrae TaxID=2055 RepID=UPI003F6AC6EB